MYLKTDCTNKQSCYLEHISRLNQLDLQARVHETPEYMWKIYHLVQMDELSQLSVAKLYTFVVNCYLAYLTKCSTSCTISRQLKQTVRTRRAGFNPSEEGGGKIM